MQYSTIYFNLTRFFLFAEAIFLIIMAFVGHIRVLHVLRRRQQLRLFNLQRKALRDASNPFEIDDENSF